MLLSLLSPNILSIKGIIDTFLNFLWCGNGKKLHFMHNHCPRMETIGLGRSFMKHHANYKDTCTYLKYIHFRTLHNRFFTNEKLFKMSIKPSNLCGFSKTEIDSKLTRTYVLKCEVSKNLWSDINNWIVDLGMANYHLSERKGIIGDLENALAINTIILITKKVVFNAMKTNPIISLLDIHK